MLLFSVISMLSNCTVERNAINNYVNVYCKKVWLLKTMGQKCMFGISHQNLLVTK